MNVVWDVICPATFAASHYPSTNAAAAANPAKSEKIAKYEFLKQIIFCPLGFEIMGPWGKECNNVFRKLGMRLMLTREN